MLKEQLQQLKKSTRTLLHKKDSLIKFIQNDDVDTYTLFNNLPFTTKYTGLKSLNFDRHKFSEREERKFNSQFAPFLKGLISKMNDEKIDIMLEYILKIYNIDTFNPREVIFLLLPYKKYFNQLKIISENTRNQFSTLKTYSISSIAKIISRDRYLFLDFVEYFKYYDILQPFLDKMLDELIEIIKTSETDYLTEFFQIMKYLVENKNPSRVLSIYHRMKSYLNTQEFVDILTPYFSLDVINMNTNTVVVDKYENIFRNNSGRTLLKNTVELHKYLNYLRSSNQVPKEFNKNEFDALMNMFFGDKLEITNFYDLIDLFKEIEPKDDFINLIIKNNAQKYFADEMDDFHKAVLFQDEFDISLLTPANYELVIKRMNQDVFESNYTQILEKTLSFVTFNPDYFQKIIVFEDIIQRDPIFKQNFIKLADRASVDLCKYFAGCNLSNDLMALSYILTHSHSVESLSILNIAKLTDNATVITDLSTYILNNISSLLKLGFDLNEHIAWGLNIEMPSCVLCLVNRLSHLVDYDVLYQLMVVTNDEKCFMELEKRDQISLIQRVVKSANVDLLLFIFQRHGIISVVERIKMIDPLYRIFLDIIVANHVRIVESITVIEKLHILDLLLQNFKEGSILSVILAYFNTLIELRKHESWIIAKSVIIESITDTHQYQLILDYILDNFELFSDEDEDLFSKILVSKAYVDVSRFKTLNKYSHMSTFVHAYLVSKGCDQVLPVIPFITPMLIKHKKSSVELLFNMYGDIMSIYIGDILDSYPEIDHLLLRIDSKQALEELCNHFDVGKMKILQRLLDSKACKDSGIFKKVYKIFYNNIGVIGQADVISLMRFYRRSLINCSKSTNYLKKLIKSIYMQNTDIFYNIADEAIQGNSNLFDEAVKLVLEGDITQCTVPAVSKFLCTYFENEGIFEDIDGNMFDEIFKISDSTMVRLISLIACNEYGNVDHAVETVLSNIQKNNNLQLSLSILLEILRIRSDIKDMYGDETISIVSVYTEDKDQVVANLSKNIIELIQ